MFLNGISSSYKLLDEYTCLLAEAMFFDLECFKYLLDVYEKVKPTMEKLLKSGKLKEEIKHKKTIVFPFMRGYLLHLLNGEESISRLECLRKCSVLDQLFNIEVPHGGSPLSRAILLQKITLAERMVELGAPIEGIDMVNVESFPIWQAVEGGHVNLVQKMLQIGIVFLRYFRFINYPFQNVRP